MNAAITEYLARRAWLDAILAAARETADDLGGPAGYAFREFARRLEERVRCPHQAGHGRCALDEGHDGQCEGA